MVKLLYKGKLARGNVQGVGPVEFGKVYDVSEPLLSALLEVGGWSRVSSTPKAKKKLTFEKKDEEKEPEEKSPWLND